MSKKPASQPSGPATRSRSAICPPTRSAASARIEAAGARLLYPPASSAAFNPAERAFAELKADLRAEAARTISDLWATIRRAFRRFTSAACRRYRVAAGRDADDPA
jgi:hypothetical protein